MSEARGVDDSAVVIVRLQELANEARIATDQPALTDPIPSTSPLAGYIDSMAVAVLVAFIEDEWELEFDEDEIEPESFASIASLAQLVEVKRSARA